MTKEEIIKNHFSEDEKVLWYGKAKKFRLQRIEFFLIPLTIFVSFILILYAYCAFMLMIAGKSAAFALSGITCLLVIFYLLYGRIWYRKKKLLKSHYFVTDRRVFVFNTFRNNILCDIPLELTAPTKDGDRILLSGNKASSDLALCLGLDVFLYNILQETPAFLNVENPDDVIKIINKAKTSRKAEGNDTNFI